MVSLWVLIILAFLAVSLGHEVSLGLRLGRYSRDNLKAYAMAQAGMNRALVELKDDNNNYDALSETWNTGMDKKTGKPLFLKKEIRDGSGEAFTIGDPLTKGSTACMLDEERKININTASQETLIALFESAASPDAKLMANSLRAFRGDKDPRLSKEADNYRSAGYVLKASPLVNIEELRLVKGMTEKLFQNLQGKVTVWGSGSININTVPVKTLKVVLRGIAREKSLTDSFADQLADKIIKSRDRSPAYKSRGEVDIALVGDEETTIYNRLMDGVAYISEHFYINVTGEFRSVNSRLAAVYEKKNKKIVYWHEE